MKIALDLEGFSALDHREIARRAQSVCNKSLVIEADHRGDRKIDAATIGVICGVVSAVCAILALALQAAEYRRKGNKTEDEDIVTQISIVEAALGERLPPAIRRNITRALESQKRPIIVELEVEQTKYVITAYGDEGAAMLQGRIKPKSIRK